MCYLCLLICASSENSELKPSVITNTNDIWIRSSRGLVLKTQHGVCNKKANKDHEVDWIDFQLGRLSASILVLVFDFLQLSFRVHV